MLTNCLKRTAFNTWCLSNDTAPAAPRSAARITTGAGSARARVRPHMSVYVIIPVDRQHATISTRAPKLLIYYFWKIKNLTYSFQRKTCHKKFDIHVKSYLSLLIQMIKLRSAKSSYDWLKISLDGKTHRNYSNYRIPPPPFRNTNIKKRKALLMACWRLSKGLGAWLKGLF